MQLGEENVSHVSDLNDLWLTLNTVTFKKCWNTVWLSHWKQCLWRLCSGEKFADYLIGESDYQSCSTSFAIQLS